MRLPHWPAAIALALPIGLAAQAAPRSDSPADPNAAVPVVRYESAFRPYRAARDDPATPDAVWRAANDAVQGEGGQSDHAGHSAPAQAASLPAVAPHAGHSPSATPPQVAPASKHGTAPASFAGHAEPAAAASTVDGHAGHAQHQPKGH